MREFKEEITLYKNGRGVYDLDPFKGCFYGTIDDKRGCYGACYAARIARTRGFDFSKVVYRKFKDKKHLEIIGKQISKVEFVRLGTMCDPSHDWDHTISIIEKIKPYNKNIVVITKHWTALNKKQLEKIRGITINTSISALDTDLQIYSRLKQYNILKGYCNSVLRVNTCDFNDDLFFKKKTLQDALLKNKNVIDNVLRLPMSHKANKSGLINSKKYMFLGKKTFISKHKDDIYMGGCDSCLEKCGLCFL